MRENSDFAMKINEINVELSGNSQRYVNKYCKSESDGKIDSFGAGCCKCRGGVTIAMVVLMLVGIVDNSPEHCSGDGTNLVSSLHCESFDWDGGYHSSVGQASR
jgi:hypothetical protein